MDNHGFMGFTVSQLEKMRDEVDKSHHHRMEIHDYAMKLGFQTMIDELNRAMIPYDRSELNRVTGG